MYGRMFVMLVISLFTARVVYNTLGIENYGLYNVVASVIVFFTFLNNGLSSATSRFITADIADDDEGKGQITFNVCVQSHLIIAAVIFLLAEIVGLWVVNEVLNIPDGREFVANVVYQLSVVSAILGIIQSPFGAVITAYERFNIYAYFTIFDVILKLLVIYLVQYLQGDKLIIYSILIFCVGVINMIIYLVYSYRNFSICKLKLVREKSKLKEIFRFMSWSIMGQAAVVGTNQGATVLVNLYHNVIANAAMGVSGTITTTVNNFVTNFQSAFRPQITKSYVTKDFDYLNNLIIRASKLSGFLIIIFFVPIMLEIENVLYLWLGESYPVLAPAFCRWTLVCLYFEALSAPLWMVMYAQTNIRNYQILISIVYSLNFFLGWLVFALGGAAFSIITVRCFVFGVLLFIRLYYANRIFPALDSSKWLRDVLGKGLLIILLSYLLVWLFSRHIHAGLFLTIVLVTLLSLAITTPMILFVGLEKTEREVVIRMATQFVRPNHK